MKKLIVLLKNIMNQGNIMLIMLMLVMIIMKLFSMKLIIGKIMKRLKILLKIDTKNGRKLIIK